MACGLHSLRQRSGGNRAGEVTDHTRVTVDFKKGELVFDTKALKTPGK